MVGWLVCGAHLGLHALLAHVGHTRLVLHDAAPVGELQRAEALLAVLLARVDRRDERRVRVAPQRVLQHARELAVAVRHVARCRVRVQRHHHLFHFTGDSWPDDWLFD